MTCLSSATTVLLDQALQRGDVDTKRGSSCRDRSGPLSLRRTRARLRWAVVAEGRLDLLGRQLQLRGDCSKVDPGMIATRLVRGRRRRRRRVRGGVCHRGDRQRQAGGHSDEGDDVAAVQIHDVLL